MTYLKNHHILSSTDLDEMRALLTAMTTTDEIDVIGKGQEIDATVHAASFGGLDMIHVSYGDTPITIQSPETDADTVLLCILTEGGATARHTHTGQSWDISVGQGFMRDLRLPFHAHEDQFAAFCVPLPIDTLKKHARTLIGEDAILPELSFEPCLDLRSPGGQQVRNTVEYIAQTLDGPLRQLDNPIALAALKDLLLTNILSLLPNAYTDMLENQTTAVAVPYYVKRVRDYIHAHADTPITLEILLSCAGCGYRTLLSAFNDAYGASPLAYLRIVRLKRIRAHLLSEQRGGGGTISDVARQWGFTHMGRFAHAYSQEFGELPSETLRKRP